MAPELHRHGAYNEKVDVYAFGIMLWEMVARQVPFDGLDPFTIKEQVRRGVGCPERRHRGNPVVGCTVAEVTTTRFGCSPTMECRPGGSFSCTMGCAGPACAGLEQVLAGQRPEIPLSCNKALKGLITECWAEDAAARPSFDKINKTLREMQGGEVM